MTDPIAEAHEILAEPPCFSNDPKERMKWAPDFGSKAVHLLLALLDEVEKWQAVAIEERAKYNHARSNLDSMRGFSFSVPMFSDLSEVAKANRIDMATYELAAEAGTWRKIGQIEQEAIQMGINAIEHDAMRCDSDIDEERMHGHATMLRTLLEAT